MTGETLYLKAQNGGKGFPAWEKLPAGQKGLWENAVREIQHEKDDARSFEAGSVLGYLSKHGCLDFTDPFTTGAVDNIRHGVHRE